MSKYKIVYRDANPSWQELCPVRVLAVQVSRDTETGACFLQTKIVNVSTKPISRIEFTVGLEGEGGETENVDFSLLDADLPAGEMLRPKAVRIKLSVITGSRAVVTRADGETSFGDPIDIDSPRHSHSTGSRSRNAMPCSPRWGPIPSNARASIPSTMDGGSAAAVR